MCLSAMSMHLLITSWDGDHHFLGQHVPMPNYSFWEQILPDIISKPPLLQLEDFSLHPNLKWSAEMKCSALMDLLADLSLGTCSCQEQIWVLLKLVDGNRWGSEQWKPFSVLMNSRADVAQSHASCASLRSQRQRVTSGGYQLPAISTT